MTISDGNSPNGGVECRWGRQKSRFWAYIWLHCLLLTLRLASCCQYDASLSVPASVRSCYDAMTLLVGSSITLNSTKLHMARYKLYLIDWLIAWLIIPIPIPFIRLLPNSWTRYFENELTDFDANWLEVGRVGNLAGYRIRVPGRYYPAGSG